MVYVDNYFRHKNTIPYYVAFEINEVNTNYLFLYYDKIAGKGKNKISGVANYPERFLLFQLSGV